MWQIILTGLSAVLLFGFTILSVRKFGLLSCLSAYAPAWKEHLKTNRFTIWTAVIIISAFLLVPVLLELGVENPNYQFLGFLAPVSLFLVGCTPDYQTSKTQNVFHQIGAWGAVLYITLYVILIPKLLPIILGYVVIGLLMSVAKKNTTIFWLEMAMYVSIYSVVLVICGRSLNWFNFLLG